MAKNLKYLFTLAVPAAGLALGAAWMLNLYGPSKTASIYETVEASRGAIRRIVATSGPVRSLVMVSVGSQLSGQVRELKADFNSEVKEGEELALIDDKSFLAKVAQSKADLAAARATLSNQQAQLLKSEAVLRQAERAIERTQSLATKGITSAAALETATKDVEIARADVAVAKAMIENSNATILQRQAVLEQATIDLDRTRIRSPINGTVISRTVDVGQTVAASLQAPELFKIAQDLRMIRIEAQVNEADVGAVAEGNPVTFTVDAYPERRFEGRVAQVRLAATELNSVVTYTVMIEAENEDRRLFPGMTATVQIETDTRDGALRVTNDAIRFRPRDRTAPANEAQASRKGGGRGNQAGNLEALKDELRLTEAQAQTLRESLRRQFEEVRAKQQGDRSAGGGFKGGARKGGSGPRQNAMIQRIETILDPILTVEQRPLFDRWKRGRENTRPATVWVLTGEGTIEARQIRVGIADDTYTEVVGGQLKQGEAVVIRAREAKR